MHGDKVRIVVPERWSRRQPLTLADLATEQTQLKGFDIRLEVVTEQSGCTSASALASASLCLRIVPLVAGLTGSYGKP